MTATLSSHAEFVDRHFKVASRSGSEYSVLCPVHGETNASLRINVDKGMFICHGCGIKGGMKALARAIGVSYRYDETEAALALLLDKLTKLADADAPSVSVYPESWLKQFDFPTDYWSRERGINDRMVDTFDLGYDPFNNAAIIPVRDVRGRILGVTRRSLDPAAKPRYRDPKGFNKSTNLFGSWLASEHESPTVVLCEGPLDAIKVWQAGIPAVAQYGSYLSPAQLKILKRMGTTTVVLFYDNDDAGQKGNRSAMGFFKELRRKRRYLPSGTTEDTAVEKWRYTPEMDLRRHFLVRRVSYKGTTRNDPGDMKASQIRRLVESARHIL